MTRAFLMAAALLLMWGCGPQEDVAASACKPRHLNWLGDTSAVHTVESQGLASIMYREPHRDDSRAAVVRYFAGDALDAMLGERRPHGGMLVQVSACVRHLYSTMEPDPPLGSPLGARPPASNFREIDLAEASKTHGLSLSADQPRLFYSQREQAVLLVPDGASLPAMKARKYHRRDKFSVYLLVDDYRVAITANAADFDIVMAMLPFVRSKMEAQVAFWAARS